MHYACCAVHRLVRHIHCTSPISARVANMQLVGDSITRRATAEHAVRDTKYESTTRKGYEPGTRLSTSSRGSIFATAAARCPHSRSHLRLRNRLIYSRQVSRERRTATASRARPRGCMCDMHIHCAFSQNHARQALLLQQATMNVKLRRLFVLSSELRNVRFN